MKEIIKDFDVAGLLLKDAIEEKHMGYLTSSMFACRGLRILGTSLSAFGICTGLLGLATGNPFFMMLGLKSISAGSILSAIGTAIGVNQYADNTDLHYTDPDIQETRNPARSIFTHAGIALLTGFVIPSP